MSDDIQTNKTYAAFMHFIPAICAVMGLSLAGLLIVLVMWWSKRDDSAFINHHGCESIRFQLIFGLYTLITVIGAIFILGFRIDAMTDPSSPITTDPSFGLLFGTLLASGGFLLPFALGIVMLIYPIYMGIQASKGKEATYRFVFSPRRKG